MEREFFVVVECARNMPLTFRNAVLPQRECEVGEQVAWGAPSTRSISAGLGKSGQVVIAPLGHSSLCEYRDVRFRSSG